MTRVLRLVIRLLVATMATMCAWTGFWQDAEASAVPPTPTATHVCDGIPHRALSMDTTFERGPPSSPRDQSMADAVDRWSHAASARSNGLATSSSITYDHRAGLVRKLLGTGRTQEQVRRASGEVPSCQGWQVATKSGTELRKVGSVLESVDDVMANPSLLKGRHPALVENILKATPGWQVEKLGRGSQAGNGWVFRQYTPAGNPTGQQLRWHPGGGHHGPDPYWRVVGPNGDLGGIIR